MARQKISKAIIRDLVESTSKAYATFNFVGNLELSTGITRWFPPDNVSIISVQALISTPATGSDVILDVIKNGNTSILSSSLFIDDGASVSTKLTLIDVDLVETDYLTVNITQIGSTTPGNTLTVRVAYTTI